MSGSSEWRHGKWRPDFPVGSAALHRLARCEVCDTLTQVEHAGQCGFCGHTVHLRKPYSVQRTLAYLLAAFIFYLPANLYPFMITTRFGREEAHTIAGGVVIFWESGAYLIAIIIFLASIFIPILKMSSLCWLCWMTSRPGIVDDRHLVKVYRITHIVGKWSMVDIFVVALMVAVLQLGSLMSVRAGPGASAFAAVVILTMLAAHAFDVRLIWDRRIYDPATR